MVWWGYTRILLLFLILALILVFNNHRCELCWLRLFAEINEKKCQLTAEIAQQRGQVQIDANRREKKMLSSSRDNNKGRYRSGEGGEEPGK